MKYIDDIDIQKGARVLMRVDFNVSVEDGVITDAFRIEQTLPTIALLQECGAHVTLLTHFGSNGTAHDMAILQQYLSERMSGFGASVVLHEKNVRDDPREEANDAQYAQELAERFDLFVQDAFAVCHREHASVVSLPKFLPSVGGLLLKKEIHALTVARTPESPSLAILGGAKFSTKQPLVETLLQHYDRVHITGALANDFWYSEGLEVGVSKLGDMSIPSEILHNEKIVLPDTVTTQNLAGEIEKKTPSTVRADEKILDAFMPKDTLKDTRSILWNGPAGYYEGGFTEGTHEIARSLAQLARDGAQVLIGGGDTLAATKELGIREQFTHVSTGGGAMLEFLLNGTLPGIEALNIAPINGSRA